MTPLAQISNRLRSEDGVAMIVAIGALSVLLTLSAFAFGASSQLTESSNDDQRQRGAFQTAEAGLDVATYRVNNLVPLGEGCVAGVETTLPSGSCTGAGTLASGDSWSYEVTPPLTSTNYLTLLPAGVCAGFPIQFEEEQNLTLLSRCITATGTSNGETTRVQARLALFTGAEENAPTPTLFPVGGIIGLSGIRLRNSNKIFGDLGSNGQIRLDNSNEVHGGATLGPGAPSVIMGNSGSVSEGTTYRTPAQGPWVLAPVGIGNTATENQNVVGWTVTGGSYSYNAGYREAVFNNSNTVTFSGGDYNFCNLVMNNSIEFKVVPGAKVRLFIDSPTRPGSGCRSGTGRFLANNSIKVTADEKVAQFQIYVFGGDVDGQPAVYINNSGEFHALIHAPLASVVVENSIKLYGAINANYVDLKNSAEVYWPPDGISGLTPDPEEPENTLTLFQRSAWRQCQSAPTTASPHSGC